MKKSHLSVGYYACVFTFISLSASAATIEVGAVDGGWYRSDGLHNSSNDNYQAGDSGATELRNWFTFDLSGVTLQAGEFVSSATLSLQNGGYGGNERETWTVVNVETDASDVMADHNPQSTDGTDIFNDLQDGSIYGSTTINSSTSPDAIIDVSLTGVNSISDITSSIGGLFAIGGYVSSLSPLTDEYLFSSSDGQLASVTLSLETAVLPVPAAFWLFGSGILGLIGIARHRV
jgi:hypothetical protein